MRPILMRPQTDILKLARDYEQCSPARYASECVYTYHHATTDFLPLPSAFIQYMGGFIRDEIQLGQVEEVIDRRYKPLRRQSTGTNCLRYHSRSASQSHPQAIPAPPTCRLLVCGAPSIRQQSLCPRLLGRASVHLSHR